MGSSSYRIGTDSINIGGADSSSANYKGTETVGEIATGDSSSTNYGMHAGYQQMQTTYISISSTHHGAMSSVNGLTGGVTDASTTWTVITDNPAGYSLSIRSATSPALQSSSGGASFADYAPASSDPDYTYTYAPTESRFGFSPEGADIASRFHDNGAICNAGGSDTSDKCWDGLSTTNAIISQGASNNQPNGATTTVKYRAAIGASKIQDSGSYSSTIIVTAVTL